MTTGPSRQYIPASFWDEILLEVVAVWRERSFVYFAFNADEILRSNVFRWQGVSKPLIDHLPTIRVTVLCSWRYITTTVRRSRRLSITCTGLFMPPTHLLSKMRILIATAHLCHSSLPFSCLMAERRPWIMVELNVSQRSSLFSPGSEVESLEGFLNSLCASLKGSERRGAANEDTRRHNR